MRYLVCLVSLLLLVSVWAEGPAPALLGPNLCTNGSFEDLNDNGQPTGWKADITGRADAIKYGTMDGGVAGKRCFYMSYTPSPVDAGKQPYEIYMNYRTAPVPATEGYYLVSLWVKVEADPAEKPFTGPIYIDRAGPGGNGLPNLFENYFYLPSQKDMQAKWQFATMVIRQRSDMKSLQVRMSLAGNANAVGTYKLCFDNVQVRKIQVPKGDGIAFPAKSMIFGGLMPPAVDAPDATTGKAIKMAAGAKRGYLLNSYHQKDLPGLYEATIRLKQETAGKAGVELCASSGNGGTVIDVQPSEFTENGKYQSIKAYYLVLTPGTSEIDTIYQEDGGAYWCDAAGTALRLVCPFSDDDMKRIKLDGVDPAKVQ